jgi:predicted MFS family arabinose efflux permease
MGILVNSWPLGIALGLMLQGPMTTSWGWQNAMLVSCLSAFVAAGFIFALYREAPHRSLAPASGWASLKALSVHEWIGLSLIGVVWSFLNVGLVLVFGFAPALLTSLGYDLGKAGQLVAIGTWVGIVAIPLGGALVTRIGSGRLFIMGCTIASALVYAVLAIRPDSMLLYLAFGITAFAAAGPIMALPSGVLAPANRAAGMGIFYTVYYVAMGILPGVAGALHDALGPRAPLIFAAVLMLISLVAQGGLTLLDRRRFQPAIVV